MVMHVKNFKPAVEQLEQLPPDISESLYKCLVRAAASSSRETAHPEIAPIYDDLMKQSQANFSCAVVTALFIADRKRQDETWWPVLVQDNEFSENGKLAVLNEHWVVTNGTIHVDLTPADRKGKNVLELGNVAEIRMVTSYLAPGSDNKKDPKENKAKFLRRLEAGLAGFNAQPGAKLAMTAEELLNDVYVPLLNPALPFRPERTITVISMGHGLQG